MRQALTFSGAGSGRGGAQAARHAPSAWLLLLLAIALGLLNPLACLVHCLPRAVSTPAASEAYAAICHIPSPGASQAPTTAVEPTPGRTQTPQAAFAFVTPIAVVLLVGVRRAAFDTLGWTASSQVFVRPLAPPPR